MNARQIHFWRGLQRRERADLCAKAKRLRRRLCWAGAVRRMWLGVRAKRFDSETRVEWPTVQGRVFRDPAGVVASLAQG